jgi:hypothetical protein
MGYNRVLGHFTNSQELAVPWQTGQLYLVNQVVINSNLLYLCNTQHTSGPTFAGDIANWVGLNPAATIGIAQGGTGQTTQTAAFDALAPTTTAGDLIVYNGTDNVRQGVGTDGQVLIADSSQPNKLKWATAPSGNTNFITNGSAEANNTTGWATYAETDAVTFTDAGDLVSTVSPHGLSNGNQISFTTITSTTGISTNTLYFVISATSTTFQVASTLNGSALPLTTNGSGTMVRFAPKTGIGGVANVTIAADPTNPLIGSYSFLLAKDAANREGQGWEYDFTIDSGYQAKVLQISFNYIVSTAAGTFVAGTSTTVSDVTVWIYDVTNGVVIQPSSSKLLANSTTVSDVFNATFQTASNSTAYRLIFHVSTPSTTAYTLKVDGITVSPSTYVYGTPVTDWQAYTPTISNFGSPTNVQFQWRRVGDNVEIRGKFTSGISTGSQGRVFLPSFNSADTTKIPSLQLAGMAANSAAAANSRTVLIEPSVGYVTFGITTSNPLTQAAASSIASSGETLSLFASIPVQGFSSSVQTSDQTDTRIVDFRAYTTSARTVNNTAPTIIFENVDKDSHGAYNAATGVYTVPVAGDYVVSGQMRLGTLTMSALSFFGFSAKINGTYSVRNHYTAFRTPVASAAGAYAEGSGSVLLTNLTAGQTISIGGYADNATTTFTDGANTFCIQRVTGPSAIAASETVTMSAYLNANANVNADAIIIWNTKEFDSHSAYSTTSGQFVAPISGTYEVSTYVYGSNPGASVGYFIWKNNTKTKVITWQPSGSNTAGYALIKLNAGDTVDIRPDTGAPRVITGGALNTVNCSYMQISKIGN